MTGEEQLDFYAVPKGANTADAAQNKASGVPEACGSWVQTSSPDAKGDLLVGAGNDVRIGDGKKPCYQAGDGAYVSSSCFSLPLFPL